MGSDILTLIGFGAAMGLVFVACWAVSLTFRDPSKETDAEKRRREKREKNVPGVRSCVLLKIPRGQNPTSKRFCLHCPAADQPAAILVRGQDEGRSLGRLGRLDGARNLEGRADFQERLVGEPVAQARDQATRLATLAAQICGEMNQADTVSEETRTGLSSLSPTRIPGCQQTPTVRGSAYESARRDGRRATGRGRSVLRRGGDETSEKLEEQMYRHAGNLDFEEAIRLCDEIGLILSAPFGIVMVVVIAVAKRERNLVYKIAVKRV